MHSVQTKISNLSQYKEQEIAHNSKEIKKNTRVYIGKLFPGIFNKNLEHVYVSDNREIETGKLEIGYSDRESLINEVKRNFYTTGYTDGIFNNPDFTVLNERKTLTLVKLRVCDLGFDEEPTTIKLYARAKEYGLAICPPEVGPYVRLQYKNVFGREQPANEYVRIAMNTISGSGGILDIFSLHKYQGKYHLDGNWTNYEDKRDLENDFIFCLEKK